MTDSDCPLDDDLAIEEIYKRALAMDHESLATGFAAAVIATPAIGKERDDARAQLAHVIDEMERMSLRAESADAMAEEICDERDKAEEQIADLHAQLGCERGASNMHDLHACASNLIDELQGVERSQRASEAIKLREIRAWHMAVTEKNDAGECIAESGECSLCGILDCDYDDPLHYHHDGCPSEYCAESRKASEEPGDTDP